MVVGNDVDKSYLAAGERMLPLMCRIAGFVVRWVVVVAMHIADNYTNAWDSVMTGGVFTAFCISQRQLFCGGVQRSPPSYSWFD